MKSNSSTPSIFAPVPRSKAHKLVHAIATYYPNFIRVYIPKNPYEKLREGLELKNNQLRWKYKKPFDLMASYTNHSSWLGIRDSYRTLIEVDDPSFLESEEDENE